MLIFKFLSGFLAQCLVFFSWIGVLDDLRQLLCSLFYQLDQHYSDQCGVGGPNFKFSPSLITVTLRVGKVLW